MVAEGGAGVAEGMLEISGGKLVEGEFRWLDERGCELSLLRRVGLVSKLAA